jgi:hypothetical protein
MTCKLYHETSKNPIVRAHWLINQAGPENAFKSAVGSKTLINDQITLKIIFNHADAAGEACYMPFIRRRFERRLLRSRQEMSPEQVQQHVDEQVTDYLKENPAPPGLPRYLLQLAHLRYRARPLLMVEVLKYGQSRYGSAFLGSAFTDLEFWLRILADLRHRPDFQGLPGFRTLLSYVGRDLLPEHPTEYERVQWLNDLGGGVGPALPHDGDLDANMQVVKSITSMDELVHFIDNLHDDLEAFGRCFKGQDLVRSVVTCPARFRHLSVLSVVLRIMLVVMHLYGLVPHFEFLSELNILEARGDHLLLHDFPDLLTQMCHHGNYLLLACALRGGQPLVPPEPAVDQAAEHPDLQVDNPSNVVFQTRRNCNAAVTLLRESVNSRNLNCMKVVLFVMHDWDLSKKGRENHIVVNALRNASTRCFDTDWLDGALLIKEWMSAPDAEVVEMYRVCKAGNSAGIAELDAKGVKPLFPCSVSANCKDCRTCSANLASFVKTCPQPWDLAFKLRLTGSGKSAVLLNTLNNQTRAESKEFLTNNMRVQDHLRRALNFVNYLSAETPDEQPGMDLTEVRQQTLKFRKSFAIDPGSKRPDTFSQLKKAGARLDAPCPEGRVDCHCDICSFSIGEFLGRYLVQHSAANPSTRTSLARAQEVLQSHKVPKEELSTLLKVLLTVNTSPHGYVMEAIFLDDKVYNHVCDVLQRHRAESVV